jgi:MFS family permease
MTDHLTSRQKIQAIAAAVSCIAVVGIGLSLSVPLLAFALSARGVSATMIGVNTAMAGLATIMIAPFIPRAAAILSVRKLLLIALLLGAATFVAFWYAEPFWMWFPLRFLFGASLAVLFVLSEFWINAVAPDSRRGLVMGIYATSLSAGFAFGPTLLAALGQYGPLPYFIGAGLFVAAALPIGLAGGLTPTLEQGPKNHPIHYLRAAPSAMLAAFVFGAVETGGMSFLPLYGLRIGYTETAAALLVSILALGNVFVQIPLGLVSDRFDRRRLLIALAIIGAVGSALLPLVSGHSAALFPVVAIWGGLVAGLYTIGLAYLGGRFVGAELAAANAAFVMMYSMGMLAGPPLLGFGLDLWDPHGLPLTISALFVAYVALVLGFRARGAARRVPAGRGA